MYCFRDILPERCRGNIGRDIGRDAFTVGVSGEIHAERNTGENDGGLSEKTLDKTLFGMYSRRR